MNITSKDIVIEIDGLKTVSESNAHEHWRARQVRAKRQRASALAHLLGDKALTEWICSHAEKHVNVTLTRLGPRKLDDDNLQGALKHVRDGVADYFGRDDGSDFYSWSYAQERGNYGVRIELHPHPHTQG